VSLITYFRKKKTEYILERERAAAGFENTLAIAKEEIVEQNLKYVSWELHDNVGQLLSGTSMELSMIKEKSNENLVELSEVSNLISKSISEIRGLSEL